MASNSADVKQLQLQISASTELLRRSIGDADRVLAGFERETNTRLGRIETSFDRLDVAAGAIKGTLLGLASGVSVTSLVSNFIELADESKALQAQLRLATREFGSFGVAQADVERIAQATRAGLSETTALYGSFVRASEQTGRTQAVAARATETFSKALKIGGADAGEAASATLQFGQALASGALRGDEFNSIAEASPRILRLLADSMGLPQGQLRKLAEEGQLTADVLFKALTDTKFTAGIDAEFREMPVTFSEAMTQVKNAAVLTFGAFDRGGDFSTALANFVTDGAGGFSSLSARATELGIDIRATLSGLADAFSPLQEGGFSAADAISGRFQGLRGEISQILGAVDTVRNFGRGTSLISAERFNNTRLGGARIGDIAGGAFRLPGEGPASDAQRRFDQSAARSELESRFRLARVESQDRARASENASRSPKPGAAPAATAAKSGTSRSSRPKAARVAPIADRVREEYGQIFASNEIQIGDFKILSDAATDVDTLKASLDSLRTGIEGVDVGSILTPEEVEQVQFYSRELDRLGEDVIGSLTGVNDLSFDDLIGEFQRLLVQMLLIEPALAALRSGIGGIGGAAGGGFVGSLLSIGSSIFGGARAAGGPVDPSAMYMVGERGPEMFVPNTRGTIIPNHRIGGGGGGSGGQTVMQSFDLRGAVVTERLYADMQNIAQQSGIAAAQIGAQLGSADAQKQVRRSYLPGSPG